MKRFMDFLAEATEEEQNIKTTMSKVPQSHSDLIKGYRYKWQAGNTLKGDAGHIGIINPNDQTITIAAPWNYGREYTLLHELGHKVWEYLVPKKMKRLWQQVVNGTKHKMQQNSEELFCMAYANHFAKNKITIHTHKTWDAFIEKVVALPTPNTVQGGQQPGSRTDQQPQAPSQHAGLQRRPV